MQIVSNIANRYSNLQVMTGEKISNANTEASFETNLAIIDEKKEKEAAASISIPTGYSYIPEIIDDSKANTGIEKISITNGICMSDNDKATEYLRELYFQKDDIDYSGMSGGEIITSIIDRYSQYFDCDDFLKLQGIANAHGSEASYVMAHNIFYRMSYEISDACEKYNIDSEQAFCEYYGFADMTEEEKMNAIVSRYSENGITYEEYLCMVQKMAKTGVITNDEFQALSSSTITFGMHQYGLMAKDAMDFEAILKMDYATVERGYEGTDISNTACTMVINDAKARIRVNERILEILNKEKKDE